MMQSILAARSFIVQLGLVYITLISEAAKGGVL